MKTFIRKNARTALKITLGVGALALAFAVGRNWDAVASEITDEMIRDFMN